MSLLTVGRPSTAKAKAIKDLEKEEQELLGVEIPASLKIRLKTHVSRNKLYLRTVIIMLIEKYLQEAEATKLEE